MKSNKQILIGSIKKIVVFFMFFFIGNHLFSQTNKIVFDHYSYNEGFYSREAMQSCTTSNGMMWITSNDGIVRFDSKRFKFYQHVEGDSSSLSSNYCTAIIADKKDRLWVSADGNLEIFNTLTEKITHVNLKDGIGKKAKVGVMCLSYNIGNDIVWIGTEHGLCYSKNGSTQIQKIEPFRGDSMLSKATINSITQDGNNILWITSGTKIIKYNIVNHNVEVVEIPNKVNGIVNTKNATVLTCSYLQKNGVLWLGTNGSGLLEYNPSSKLFHQYVYSDYTKTANTVMGIIQTHFAEDENILWLSTGYIGLQTFNINTKKFAAFNSTLENDKYTIKIGNTYGLFLQEKKALWIGSGNGLHKYDFNKQLFKTIDLTSLANGINMLPVGSIATENTGNYIDDKLWIHIPYHGGHIYSIAKKSFEKIPALVSKYFQPPTNFWDVFIDKNNIAWMATGQYGLIGYDIIKQKIILGEKSLFFKEWEWVNGFFEDSKGTIWLQTFNGLFKIDGTTHEVTEAKEVNQLLSKEGLSLSITGIDEDEKGTLWMITDFASKGKAAVLAYYPDTKKVKIVFNEKTNQSFRNWHFDLRSIVYKNQKLFIANHPNGLMVISNPLSNASIHFLNKEQGVLDTYISSIVKDSLNNIWSSNGTGISSYNDKQNVFSNYSSSNYSLGNDNEPYMYLSKQSNNLYLGQVNSINYFNVYSAQPKNDAKFLFTEIKIFNKEYKAANFPFLDGETITLSHLQNMISVEFALLSYTNSNENTYSWKLEGLEKEWNTSRVNIASYTNLKPGNYTLLVKAANSYGEWTSKPIKLFIKIKAPYYNTWWFYLLCLLFTASMVYWLVQLRIKRINEKNKLRNKIASDLHDEIGSTLTSINILSNVSQQAMEEQPMQAKEMMQQIAQQSKTIQQSMSDIVWSIRSENEKIGDLLVRMREYAAQTLEPLNINTTIEAEENVSNKNLPMEYRKDLLLIYKEAINNIAKHANATAVAISLINGNNTITLTIQDNGTWKGNNSGTGTKTMQERAEKLNGKLIVNTLATGTKINVIIPVP